MGRTFGQSHFDWEGVRRGLRGLAKQGFHDIFGVVYVNHRWFDGSWADMFPAQDIADMCAIEKCPRLDDASDADDEVTIQTARGRKCLFLDNDNYRDWRWLKARSPNVRTTYSY